MVVDKPEKQLLAEISQKLDRLIGIIAIQGKDLDAQIETLYALGFEAPLIGSLLGMSANAVRLWKFRRKKGRTKAKIG